MPGCIGILRFRLTDITIDLQALQMDPSLNLERIAVWWGRQHSKVEATEASLHPSILSVSSSSLSVYNFSCTCPWTEWLEYSPSTLHCLPTPYKNNPQLIFQVSTCLFSPFNFILIHLDNSRCCLSAAVKWLLLHPWDPWRTTCPSLAMCAQATLQLTWMGGWTVNSQLELFQHFANKCVETIKLF